MPALTSLASLRVVRAELRGPTDAALDRHRLHKDDSTGRFLEMRPKAENQAIALLVELCREYRTPTHIVHLSSVEALAALPYSRGKAADHR